VSAHTYDDLSITATRILRCCALVAVASSAFVCAAFADSITIAGGITQSVQDGTGPAVNNTSLNNIDDLQAYTLTLVFPGSIAAPGMYNLTGSSLTFSVPAAPASETIFSTISVTITQNAGFDEFSLLACLANGGCLAGNQLTANFKILATGLNSQNVPAIGLDQPHPMDLLEDDGTTDIQGSITTFNGSATAVPETSSLVLVGFGLAALGAKCRRGINRGVKARQEKTI